MVHIKFIIGSVRPNRFGLQPATWLMDLAKQYEDKAQFELIDLKELNLPFLDESELPAYGNYANEHTKDWAKTVGDADGFVMITPEYNHSTSPVLKNAIDFVGPEWRDKPVAFVGYGAEAGGARAIEHLRSIVGWLSMYDLHNQLTIHHYWTQQNEDGTFIATKEQEERAKHMLEKLIFWAEDMKAARERLAKK